MPAENSNSNKFSFFKYNDVFVMHWSLQFKTTVLHQSINAMGNFYGTAHTKIDSGAEK